MTLPLEFKLICLAIRACGDAEAIPGLRAAAAAGPDWSAVIEAASHHRVAGPVLAGLQAGAVQVPANDVAALRNQVIGGAGLALAQGIELARVAQAFDEARLPMLALKGLALSAQLYGDPAQRAALDLDILVDAQKLIEADSLLQRLGYKREEPRVLTPRRLAAFRRRRKDLQYTHAETGTVLELHHRLTSNALLLRADFASLWSERDKVRVGGMDIATLPKTSLALYLCVHGAGHCWERLRWLLDFMMAVESFGGVDRAIADAEAAGLKPVMLHALTLAHDWLGFALDDSRLAEARADSRAAVFTRHVTETYAGSGWLRYPAQAPMEWLKIRARTRRQLLAMKQGWKYHLEEASDAIFNPSDGETMGLPDGLFFLYPLFRPVAWIARKRGK